MGKWKGGNPGLQASSKRNQQKGQEGRRNHGLFLCWITHLSPLSLILFAFLGGLLFQRETKQFIKSPMATQHTATDMNMNMTHTVTPELRVHSIRGGEARRPDGIIPQLAT